MSKGSTQRPTNTASYNKQHDAIKANRACDDRQRKTACKGCNCWNALITAARS